MDYTQFQTIMHWKEKALVLLSRGYSLHTVSHVLRMEPEVILRSLDEGDHIQRAPVNGKN